MELIDTFLNVSELKEWEKNLTTDGRHMLTGLVGSSKTLMIAKLLKDKKVPQLIVESDLYHAQQLQSDLENIIEDTRIELFPVEDMLVAEMATSSPEYRAQRVSALTALTSENPVIVITTVAGIRRFLPSVEYWKQHEIQLEIGKEVDPAELEKKLFEMGYIRSNMVNAPGDFAIRGSIVDIFPLDADNPYRIDFFDIEIDSMRTFDIANQRSIENVEQVTIIPATDFIASKEVLELANEKIKKEYNKQFSKLKNTKEEKLTENIQKMLADFKDGFLKAEYLPYTEYIYPQSTNLIDYLSDEGLVIFDDYSRLTEKQKNLEYSEADWLTDRLRTNSLFDNLKLGHDFRSVEKKIKQPRIFLSLFQKGLGRMKFAQLVDIKTRAVQKFFGQMPLLKTEVSRWEKQKQTVVFLINDRERLEKVSQTLDDFEIKSIITDKNAIQVGVTQVVQGFLNEGFEIPKDKLVVLTENELFSNVKKKQPRRLTMNNAERLKSYTELKKGDYVVHVNHGIGRYMGMQTLEVGGHHHDYMTILYQDDAKLFIPVSQLDKIQKYVSSESKTPRVNKLGGSEWAKTKRRVANKIEDIADELVDLYAKREAEKGYAFAPDDSYQKEFEDAFPYTETPDQLRSAKEIKQDMEKTKPMDRLLIGDVGYGKTEVALRAAFKAVQDGKQVAFLAPTTVLAQQHYETMEQRFENFPVEIGILSRFNTAKEIKETIENLETGKLDIVVGTHRLLSKDVKFADLGLLIIDEEQRFGVKHKERLKELKTSVDVLTLTATPIPRTLNMSMLGVRDLSVIETAPMNRYPIQTYVIEKNYGVIVDGIKREIERGGQVFYLHNRVDDIEKVASELESLVPEAKVAYIHGRMTETQLENILIDFIDGEYDVLVTTTIIETGVDIPNVNTLFVDNADRMGLSQLYQLRGRVGRSNRIAYAYFMYQPNKVLTEVAEKRLEAIKDFTELGSGFKIAMRDLSIRGAGNLLGKQQHGFIDSVGYDLYTQMLNDAVAKKRGKEIKVKTDAELNLDLEAYLPADYITDPKQKVEIYKRIHQFENEDQYIEVQDDLIDRFGEYPIEVHNLLEVGLLKMYADAALVDSVSQNKKTIEIELSDKLNGKLDIKDVFKVLSVTKFSTTLGNKNQKIQIKLNIQPGMESNQILEELKKLLKELAKMVDVTMDKSA
ncbi:transcription-repair coupling factor [Lactobacillus sp. UMNPBX2]|nr:transcription-repair coupling factor [Lactobacillus sp. UMNPBX2]